MIIIIIMTTYYAPVSIKKDAHGAETQQCKSILESIWYNKTMMEIKALSYLCIHVCQRSWQCQKQRDKKRMTKLTIIQKQILLCTPYMYIMWRISACNTIWFRVHYQTLQLRLEWVQWWVRFDQNNFCRTKIISGS